MKELNVSKNTIKSIINTTLTSKQIDDAVKEYGILIKAYVVIMDFIYPNLF